MWTEWKVHARAPNTALLTTLLVSTESRSAPSFPLWFVSSVSSASFLMSSSALGHSDLPKTPELAPTMLLRRNELEPIPTGVPMFRQLSTASSVRPLRSFATSSQHFPRKGRYGAAQPTEPQCKHLSRSAPLPFSTSSSVSAYPSTPDVHSFLQECTCLFDELPNELILHIFSFLDASELTTVSAVCYRWLLLARDDQLWTHLIKARWTWVQAPFLERFHGEKSLLYQRLVRWTDQCVRSSDMENFDGVLEAHLKEHARQRDQRCALEQQRRTLLARRTAQRPAQLLSLRACARPYSAHLPRFARSDLKRSYNHTGSSAPLRSVSLPDPLLPVSISATSNSSSSLLCLSSGIDLLSTASSCEVKRPVSLIGLQSIASSSPSFVAVSSSASSSSSSSSGRGRTSSVGFTGDSTPSGSNSPHTLESPNTPNGSRRRPPTNLPPRRPRRTSFAIRQAKKKREMQLKKLFFLALGLFALVVIALIFARIGIVFGQVFNVSFFNE